MATTSETSTKGNGAGRAEAGTTPQPPAATSSAAPQRPREGTARPGRASEPSENTIRPRRLRERVEAAEPASDAPKAERAAQPNRPLAPNTSSTGTSDTDPWTVPAAVRERFHQEGKRFYFPDGHLAFRDHGRKLSTQSENTEVVHSLIEIARSRGWAEITVSGTERFRQEAWREARLSGLAVRGYRPTDAERAALIQSLERRKEEGAGDPRTGAASSQPDVIQESGSLSPRQPRSREDKIVGKLVDHGRETYRFDPHEEISYFVTIDTPHGKRTIWGKDLGRAMEKSLTQPTVGDEIALKRTGEDAVTVKRRERNEEGQVLKETDLATHRNRWVIEKRDFFESRESAAQLVRDPQIEPRQAVKSHPELAGTYLGLHAAKIAARAIRDPQDQQRFVDLVRGSLADAVARGDPLQPVRLRERARERPQLEREPAARA